MTNLANCNKGIFQQDDSWLSFEYYILTVSLGKNIKCAESSVSTGLIHLCRKLQIPIVSFMLLSCTIIHRFLFLSILNYASSFQYSDELYPLMLLCKNDRLLYSSQALLQVPVYHYGAIHIYLGKIHQDSLKHGWH